MKTITRTQFSGTPEQLVARVESFRNALAAHAETVGVPAPREADWIEQPVRDGEPYELEPPPEEPRALTVVERATFELEAKRVAALRALETLRLEAAIADPNAPDEVKSYRAARDAAQ